MNRVPKAARAQCATAYCDNLTKISTDPTQLVSWDCLFSFALNILAKPPRGGSNRNLANVVLKRLAGLTITNQLHQTPKTRGLTRLLAIKTHAWLQLSPANWKPASSGPLSASFARMTFPRQQTPKRCKPCRKNIQTFIRPSRPKACLFTNGKSKISTVASFP